ncbi:MAG: ATP-binding region ATPase domain protein [Segetibacter sp.]|nr:ATP-binding region ATPase domain protein [Segetibacter sp.]
MKFRFASLLLILFIFNGYPSFSQRTTIFQIQENKRETDSLLRLLEKTNDSRQKVLIYQTLAWKLRNTSAEDKAIYYADQGIALARKINFKKAEADITRFKGMMTWNFLHQNITYDLYNAALSLSKEIGDKEGEAYSYDRLGIASFYNKKYSEAIQYFEKARKIFTELKNKEGLGYVYSHLNWVFTTKKEYYTALEAGRKSLNVRIDSKNDEGTSNSLADIGLTYSNLNQDSAIFYLEKAISLDKAKQMELLLAEHTGLLSDLYLQWGNYDKALEYANESYLLGCKNNSIRQMEKTSKVIASAYEKQNNYQKALEFLHIYYDAKDSLFNAEINKNIVQQEMQYKYDKEKEVAANKEKFTKVILISVILLLSIIAVIIQIGRRRKQKDNEVLKLKNNEISQQKEEILKQAEQLQELNKMKNSLFSVISHDLRSPIGSTLLLLELLEEKSLSEDEFLETLPRIIDQLKQTSGLLDNLLLWAKTLMDGKRVFAGKFDLAEITKKNIDLIEISAKKKSISIINKILNPVYVNADMAMIDVVFRNLLSNGVKFCRPGDAITISAKILDSVIEVKIQDTGVGISASKVSSLFVAQSVTTKGTENEVGTGLGLILCKEFVERNGGKIWVESDLGTGSAFYFTIPRQKL